MLQAAKKQLNDCDKEIGEIRAVLRSLGTGDDEPNSLTVQWINNKASISSVVSVVPDERGLLLKEWLTS